MKSDEADKEIEFVGIFYRHIISLIFRNASSDEQTVAHNRVRARDTTITFDTRFNIIHRFCGGHQWRAAHVDGALGRQRSSEIPEDRAASWAEGLRDES